MRKRNINWFILIGLLILNAVLFLVNLIRSDDEAIELQTIEKNNNMAVADKVVGEGEELFTIDEGYNMAVAILFDKETPTVSFVSPDGKIIEGTSLEYEGGEDWVQYYIPNATTAITGKWKIIYDRKSNTEIEISYSSYMDTTITELSFGEAKGEYLPVNFTVASSADQEIEYMLYAAKPDKELNIDTVLAKGSADINMTTTLDAYIGDLDDDCKYKLRLDIWQKQGTEEAYDSKTTDECFLPTESDQVLNK